MHCSNDVIHISIYIGEALRGVREAWPVFWDLGYRAVGQDREVRVHQGVCHICQFPKMRIKIGLVHPPHLQYQVDADNAALIFWC